MILIDNEIEIPIKLGFVAIFCSVCSFPLSELEGNLILKSVILALELYSHELRLTDGVFSILANLRKHTEHYLEMSWRNGLFECTNLLRTDLSIGSIVTILQYYGEAIQDGFPIPSLDFHKLSDLMCNQDHQIADTAIWLIWNCILRQDHSELFDSCFIQLLFRVAETGTFSMLKYSLLIWSRLTIEASADQISDFVIQEFVIRACEVLIDEIDDVDLELALIDVLLRLLTIENAEIQILLRETISHTGLLESNASRSPNLPDFFKTLQSLI
jgi:hypothetical protein